MWKVIACSVCATSIIVPVEALPQGFDNMMDSVAELGMESFGRDPLGSDQVIVDTIEIDPAASLEQNHDEWKGNYCLEHPSDIICLTSGAEVSDGSFFESFSLPPGLHDIVDICILDPDAHPSCSPENSQDIEQSLEALPLLEALPVNDNVADTNKITNKFRIDVASNNAMTGRQDSGVHCNNKANRPVEVWREIITRANENKICSDRVRWLERAYTSVADRELNRVFQAFLSGDSSVSWDDGLGLSFVRDAKSYVEACTTPLNSLKKTTAYSMLFGPAGVDRLPEALGVLKIPGRRHYCSATIVRTSSDEIGLLTAAHCLNAGEANANPLAANKYSIFNFSLYDSDIVMQFESFSNKYYDVVISKDMYGYTFNNKSDIAFLKFDGSNDSVENLKRYALGVASNVSIWEPIYIIGSNPFWYALHSLSGLDKQELLNNSLVLEHGSHCRFLNVDNGYVSHGCQTEGSMSGSALIVIEDGRPVVAGVHTGAVEDVGSHGRPEQCRESSIGGKNTGVLFPSVTVNSDN